MKMCTRCRQTKNLDDFYKDKKGDQNRRSQCKNCERQLKQVKTSIQKGDQSIVNFLKKKTARNLPELFCEKCKRDLSPSEYNYNKECLKCATQKFLNKKKFKNIPGNLNVSHTNFSLKRSSAGGFFRIYEYKKSVDNPSFRRDLEELLKIYSSYSIKVSFEADILFASNESEFNMTKRNDKFTLLKDSNLPSILDSTMKSLYDDIYERHHEKSGLSIQEITGFRVYINPFLVAFGSSWQPLPDRIKNSKSCLNIKNYNDNKCLLWCLLASLNNSSSDSPLYKLEKTLNMNNISYPTPLNQVPLIESQNNLSINIYLLHENMICPVYISPSESKKINILLYKNHYILIVDINKLLSTAVKGNNSAFVCELCGVSIFSKQAALEKHLEKCKHRFKVQKFVITKEPCVKFKNFQNKIKVPFVIYADFESFFSLPAAVTNTPKIIYEKMHVPMGFAFKTVCRDDASLNNFDLYLGPDADKKFIKNLVQECTRLNNILADSKEIIMTESDQINFDYAGHCFLCQKHFNKRDIKVRDHNHITGEYRGAAHQECNLKYTKKSWSVPVIFHNLVNYDLHLFIDSLHSYSNEFFIIPKSKEKYITLIMKIKNLKIKLKFIDSLYFISGSLADNAKKITHWSNDIAEDLRSKQFFPYSYFTSLDKLNDEKLPPVEAWTNDLTGEKLPLDDYNWALYIWDKYKCKTLHDYTSLYLSVDVLLLSEVFESFRSLSMETYDLDPCNYFTTPGLAWDAALSTSNVVLDTLKDNDIINFFIEKGTMRGGISTVCRKKWARANNKYMHNFNPQSKSSYIMYFDVTNLYGFIMTDYLPTGNFKWLDSDQIIYYEKNIHELFKSIGSDKGYILEVDLEYPTHLHKAHIELPLAPEHVNGKLSPNLNNKYNYRLRIENLEFYLQHGLVLLKIYKILEFSQSRWLKKYIDFNTEKRKNSSDENAKNFYKLMNNSVYGKTMENVFGRKNYKLVNNQNSEKILKLTRSENFKNEFLLTEHLTLIELEKEDVIFDKPIYVGFSILELSKLHMYYLHYDVIKKFYGDNATLMYMDTDSLVYEIFTEDVYDDISLNMRDNFDLSVYPSHFKSFDPSNKGVLGTLKDEFASKDNQINTIVEFTCLRSKCYSLLTEHDQGTKKCKGVKKCEVKKLKHQDFVNCNINGGIIEIKQKTFKSVNHNIYTIETTKDSLSRYDDKRIIDASMGTPLIYTVPIGFKI